MPVWIKEKLFQKDLIARCNRRSISARTSIGRPRLLFSEHHLSHAASAFFPSPFDRAAVLTMDGVGEWTTTSLAVGNGNDLKVVQEIHFPHSLGLLYSAFTYYTGFKVNSGEYKVMGLAPYGEPRYVDLIRKHLIDIKDDGTFRLNMDYFDYCTGLRMTNERFDAAVRRPARSPESALTQREMDLTASVQAITEEIVLKLGRSIARETGERNLCLAGGVALNCVANGKLLRDKSFDRIWIQPAAGDAGGALGAALGSHYLYQGPAAPCQQADAMQCGAVTSGRSTRSPTSRSDSPPWVPAFALCPTPRRSISAPRHWPTARRSAGTRVAWSSDRARWAAGRSWATPARRPCRSC